MNNNKQKLELTWIGKNNPEYDIANIEPRILEERTDLSYGDKDTENMIIHGDNLLALKALLPEYEGKVKCIYIDPPFNTGNAFEHYDDSVEHSTWLSLMKPRLELLRKLLSEDGVISIHIDDIEYCYLKVLLDEVFGRDNFINTIAIRDSHPSGLKLAAKDKKIIKTKSYIVIYKKSYTTTINPIYQSRSEWDIHYSIYVDTDSKNLEKKTLKEVLLEKNIIDSKYSINETSLRDKNFRKFVFDNRLKVFQSTKEMPDTARKLSIENKDKVIEYDSNGERGFAYNGRRLFPLSKSIQNVGIDGEVGKEDFGKLLCDFWDDIDFNNSQNEGGVQFPASKKPEYLLGRILTMFSNKGEYVLDSFLGSGTTASVAHKIGRKYIGIEMGEHAYTHVHKRMKDVVDGIDQSGISKAVEWKGGGGYKFYELAPSFVVIDEFGNPVIDSYYNDVKLIRAMCKLTNYTFAPSPSEYWKHGKGQGKNNIYVTTQMLSVAMVQQITSHLSVNETLLICPKKFEPGCEKVDARITIKKIPQSVLKACQFGKKEYLLPIRERAMEEIDEEESESDE
ncbi:MAG: site-specific DNA-methyltransferase [Patescibacteria group bacterium]